MQNWLTSAQELYARERRFVLVSVAADRGSAPRGAGTKMLVSEHELIGTIGGGNLEFQVIEQARKLLAAEGGPDYIFQNYALGPLLEQCCGGSVDILLERIEGLSAKFLRGVQTNTLKTTFEDGKLSKVWLEEKADTEFTFYGETGEPLDGAVKAASYLLETSASKSFPLILFGAGHVGRATVKILADLPFHITWVDSRTAEFPGEIPANVTPCLTDEPLSVIASAPENTLFVIFTHNHQLDYELTKAILERQDAKFCGLIGSATKRARFENRLLRERVITEEELDQLTCPIGIAGITGKEPEIIAASLTAQLLQVIN